MRQGDEVKGENVSCDEEGKLVSRDYKVDIVEEVFRVAADQQCHIISLTLSITLFSRSVYSQPMPKKAIEADKL